MRTLIVAVALLAATGVAIAQDAPAGDPVTVAVDRVRADFNARLVDYDQRIQALEARVAAREARVEATDAAPAPAATSSTSAPAQ